MREEITNWWKQAQRDLLTAENSLKSKDFYQTAFMSQQASEKALKAYLMLTTKESIFNTHSLVFLGRKAKLPLKLLDRLRQLAPEYTISRYPDVAESLPYDNYSAEIALDRLNRAKELFTWLDKRMK
ncbi:MAG: HEPN domain-containing protein [Patescibacteria group bacterium]|jgi:HEPN domain-containing protein